MYQSKIYSVIIHGNKFVLNWDDEQAEWVITGKVIYQCYKWEEKIILDSRDQDGTCHPRGMREAAHATRRHIVTIMQVILGCTPTPPQHHPTPTPTPTPNCQN